MVVVVVVVRGVVVDVVLPRIFLTHSLSSSDSFGLNAGTTVVSASTVVVVVVVVGMVVVDVVVVVDVDGNNVVVSS